MPQVIALVDDLMLLSRSVAIVAVGLLTYACREAPPPTPARTLPPAAPGELRPLTSRDGPPTTPGRSQGLPSDHPPLPSRATAPAGDDVSGTVTVAAGLAGRVQPTDVLYLIARNPKTSGVVAVRREDGVRLPFTFRLTAADVMVEGTAFLGPFDVTARLSKTGDAIAGKGDLEGSVRGVAAGASGITVTLDSVRQ